MHPHFSGFSKIRSSSKNEQKTTNVMDWRYREDRKERFKVNPYPYLPRRALKAGSCMAKLQQYICSNNQVAYYYTTAYPKVP